ncbi:MAG: tetratricopeptide repeat protein [Rhodospirillales bacterium]|nr:tetratricopeptide repeat protein [Rhodospirillales bacterium]
MSGMSDDLAQLEAANRLADQGLTREAMELLASLEGFGPAHANLALLFEQKQDLPAALHHHRRAVALMADHAQVWFNAANALEHARQYAESEAACRQAIALKPDFAEAWHNLGNCLQEQGRVAEADQAFRQALTLRPGFETALSSHLMNLHYLPEATPEAIFEVTKQCAARFLAHDRLTPSHPGDLGLNVNRSLKQISRADSRAKPEPFNGSGFFRSALGQARIWPDEKRQSRPLKIGLLCAYVRRHPLGSLAVAGLERLDRKHFSLTAYVNQSSLDSSAQRLRAACNVWREIGQLSDEAAARQIQADKIDILIDLAGHTRGHRLGVMALKPAPVQIHWGAAYWNGPGLPAIDYLLTDRIEVPPGHPPPLLERPLYLQDSFACFLPPENAPPIAALPMLERGAPSFASFNRLAKLNDGVLALWGRLMAKAPKGARLIVQAHAFDDMAVQARFLERLAVRGIDATQVELIGALAPDDVLKAYAKADIVLDSFPWSGSIVTLEALFMGLPVVTWPHPTIAGRHSASFLTTLGETGWIATNEDDYLAKALDLVSDAKRLAGIRQGLRDRLLASPLCDAARFAQNLEAALLLAWEG